MFNVYAPIRDSSEAVHAAFLGDLDKACREVKAERKRRPLLVMGDFNAPITLVTNPSMDPPAVSQLKGLLCSIGCKSAHTLCPSKRKWTCELPGRRAETKDRRNVGTEKVGQKGEEGKVEMGRKGSEPEGTDNNGMVKRGREGEENGDKACEYMHVKGEVGKKGGSKRRGDNKVRRQLDHIMVSERFACSIRRHKVLKAPVPTVHCVVMADVKIKWRSKGTGGQSKVPWPRLGDEEKKASFQQAVWEMAKKEEEITWEYLSENMVHTAQRLSKKDRTPKTTNAPTGTENTPPGTETPRISGFRDLFLQSRKPDHFKEVLKEHGEEIEAQIGQECAEIEAGLRRNRSNPWRTLRRICGLYRETLCIETSSTRETLNIVKDFFARMGSDDRGDKDIKFDKVVSPKVPINDESFTVEELEGGISRLARNKAHGIDQIPEQALRMITEHAELRKSLLHIINEVHRTGVSPASWKIVLQVPIPKKGDLTQIANWQPICLVNSAVKLMNAMILKRIRPSIEPLLRDSQFGFRPERSTAGAQIILNDARVRATRGKKGIAVAFMDFAKAFPSVSFHAIRAALNAFHVGPALTRMVMSLYSNLKGIVRTPYGNTDSFPIETGILQGDVLAPYLFVLVIDRILNKALDNKPLGILLRSSGTKSRGIQEFRLKDIDYADDIALLASTKHEISQMIEATANEAKPANLRIAVGKTKTAWMAFGKVPGGTRELRAGSLGKIPLVDSYRHLGHLQDATASSPIKDRLRITWAAFRKLSGIWASPLSAATKIRLFDCLIYPILTFGAACLSLSNKMLRKTEVEVNMMRRFACNSAKLDDFGHCYPLESLYCGTPRFSTVHRVARAKIVGHMLRHSSTFRELVQWNSTEKTRNISPSEASFNDLGVTLEQALVYSQDRIHWQKLCDELRQELEPLPMYEVLRSPRWKTKHTQAVKKQKLL